MMKCKKCGGEDIRKNGQILTTKGTKQRYQCKACGSTAIEAKLRTDSK